MGLDALLSKLETRRADTPDTPCNLAGVSGNPATIGACTLDTPDTPEKHNTPPQPEITTCKTCAHVCRTGCCGEPVRAGLSPVEGVISYGHADTCEAFEERAAIMEYDGGLSRDEAERQAREIVGRTSP